MMNEKEIRALEKRASDGWPGLVIEEYDGWQLRFAKGYTGRANSTSHFGESKRAVKEVIAYCEEQYAKRGLPCNFKVTDADQTLTEALKDRGYKTITPTDVMILDVKDEAFSSVENGWREDPGVQFVYGTAHNDNGWIKDYFALEGIHDEQKQAVYEKIHSSVKAEKLYIKIIAEEKTVGVASCAIEEGYSLLQNVIIDPAFRGQGLGKRLCMAAILKSREMGATYFYLQVLQDNEVAISLYKKLGYKKAYAYCYMRNA
ncbi:MAG: GNAT family N-acetyltransferase [Lachnospiraceae bacterium]|nr:GNAT family N-acetyltransferase [Lachnospiraceae bacterium]